jgi:phage recombination protein Bet
MTTERALVKSADNQLTSSQILAGLNTVRSVLAPDLTAEELKLFAIVSSRSGLDPFAKQIYAVKRQGRVTFQTGIDGYRSIAARTGLYDGQDEPEYGPVCACGDKRPDGHPEWATVRVYRKGVGRAIAATAFWHEYKPEQGQSGRQDAMWVRMPRVMIAKVAEALALRKAFPYDPENRMGIGADVYTADEMAQAARSEPATPSAQPSARDRIAQRAAAIVAPAPDPEPEPPAPEPDAADEIVGEATEVPGLSVAAFKDLCVKAGKSTVAIAKVLECVPGDVASRVLGMSPVERGVLADELGIEWSSPA